MWYSDKPNIALVHVLYVAATLFATSCGTQDNSYNSVTVEVDNRLTDELTINIRTPSAGYDKLYRVSQNSAITIKHFYVCSVPRNGSSIFNFSLDLMFDGRTETYSRNFTNSTVDCTLIDNFPSLIKMVCETDECLIEDF